MGKQPVRMKAVIYALSPLHQKVMPGLWNDLPSKIHHKISENWLSTILLLGPLFGTCTYVQRHQEREKLVLKIYKPNTGHLCFWTLVSKMTANGIAAATTYEEVRKQRLEQNKKIFEDLGISKISKNLTDLTNSQKKSQQNVSKFKSKGTCTLEPRRSSRARNQVLSYCDDVNVDLPPLRKRSRSSSSSWASYLARPVDEVKVASYEERVGALKAAEELQSSLLSENPCFTKSMVRSHVYSCFWLGLPSKFCECHLSTSVLDMILEDESGKEYEATYIGKRAGLSGGWRAFALDHKLDDGDALVFELTEPTRFKVYIVRASMLSDQEYLKSLPERSTKCKRGNEVKEEQTSPSKKNGFVSKKLDKATKSNGPNSVVGDRHKGAILKPIRKPAPKLFRKRA
ncbi:hypothetical protein FNV43_RR05228 [Rhamnella rubrinervis]|uniref:TF-B3 domain-containing protein n=1 Tax=Rhamnella rubrinervis TaxID=2594499 RepID=A0A8K0HLS5_9ROSA|nr:hypothetical protein FNV43_RR05228 [Rhamnella rubrinervis]